MRIDKTIGIIGGIFILAGIGSMLFLPGEKKWNKDADIRVGSGADISGVIMEETLQKINEKYKVSTSTESSSFQDCCSNTAQWALNAKEINVGFYCPHIAKHTIENNEDVEIYGPVLMNGETIVYKKDWADVKNVGITQGRQQEKALAKAAYPQIEGFDGREFTAMCAIDAMGAAFTFHQDTEVHSVCAMCEEPVYVKIVDGKVADYAPKTLHALTFPLGELANWAGSC